MTILRNNAGAIWAVMDSDPSSPRLTLIMTHRRTHDLHSEIVNGQHSFWVPGRNRESRIAAMRAAGYTELSVLSADYMDWRERIEKFLLWQALAQ